MGQTRLSLLRSILRNRIVRYGGAIITGLAFWDVLSNQFNFPKIPKVWDMTGALLPIWAWLIALLCVFVFGLFEYVRQSIPLLTEVLRSKSPEGEQDRYAELDEDYGPSRKELFPDLSLKDLGERIASKDPEKFNGKDAERRVNLEIADEVAKRELTVWGRFANFASDPFSKYDLRHAIYDYKRNSLKIPNSFHVNEYTDIMFVSDEVDAIWPPETSSA